MAHLGRGTIELAGASDLAVAVAHTARGAVEMAATSDMTVAAVHTARAVIEMAAASDMAITAATSAVVPPRQARAAVILAPLSTSDDAEEPDGPTVARYMITMAMVLAFAAALAIYAEQHNSAAFAATMAGFLAALRSLPNDWN